MEKWWISENKADVDAQTQKKLTEWEKKLDQQ